MNTLALGPATPVICPSPFIEARPPVWTPGYPLAKPILGPVTATVAGLPATIQYAGSAPGGIYGFTQVNIAIPANAPSGAQPVVISFGSYSTQPGVTVAVH